MNQILNISWVSGLIVNAIAWLDHAANVNMLITLILGMMGVIAAYLKIKLMLIEYKAKCKKQSDEKANNHNTDFNNRNRNLSNKV